MKSRPSAFRSRAEISKSLLADVAGKALHRSSVVSARFGGVGAWCVRSNSAVFWSARPTIGIHGNNNAVVFPEIGDDGYFDYKGRKLKPQKTPRASKLGRQFFKKQGFSGRH